MKGKLSNAMPFYTDFSIMIRTFIFLCALLTSLFATTRFVSALPGQIHSHPKWDAFCVGPDFDEYCKRLKKEDMNPAVQMLIEAGYGKEHQEKEKGQK